MNLKQLSLKKKNIQKDSDIEDFELKNDFSESDFFDDVVEEKQKNKEHYLNLNESRSNIRIKNYENVEVDKYNGKKVTRKEIFSDLSDGRDSDNKHEGISDDETQLHYENQGSKNNLNESDVKREILKNLIFKEKNYIKNIKTKTFLDEVLKGYTIKQNNELFEKLVFILMKIQPLLESINRFPVGSDFDLNTQKLFKGKSKSLKDIKKKCYKIIDQIQFLREAFSEKDPDSQHKKRHKDNAHKKKRSFSTYIDDCLNFDTELETYRANVLLKWSYKTHMFSKLKSIDNNFKSFNQSAEDQVQNALADYGTMLKKTKINRLNSTLITSGLSNLSNSPLQINENESSSSNAKSHQIITKNAEHSSIYDHTDFYKVLINQVIDKKYKENDITDLPFISKKLNSVATEKKIVDQKASKGRKLKFEILQPITNFDYPKKIWKWNNIQIDEFFASLFGKKINLSEKFPHFDFKQENSIKLFS